MPRGVSTIPRICAYCEEPFTARNGAQQHCSDFCKFWSKVRYAGGDQCWLWTAGFFDDGYGIFWNERAHRVAWKMIHRSSPGRLLVCHSCDTPACVRPGHLWLGTNNENLKDRDRKQRHGFGQRNGRAKLTEDDVRAIRASPLSGPELAQLYGVHKSQINRARRGTLWRHVP